DEETPAAWVEVSIDDESASGAVAFTICCTNR
ncbi:MAG: hypothetical protein JWP55_951, partial [Mycobacterium sp.]|nr:hypothetical protein [Mycobacterium sp.]